MVKVFHTPNTPEEAVALKYTHKNNAQYLAGGTEINRKESPEHLISLAKLGLDKYFIKDDECIIGANVTLQQLVEDCGFCDALNKAALHVTNRNIRVMATIGGQIGAAKSCGNLLPTLVASNSTLDVLTDKGISSVSILEYLEGTREGLILSICMPRANLAVDRFVRTANDISIITAAVGIFRDGDHISSASVAVGGVSACVRRLPSVEAALLGTPPSRDDIEALVKTEISPISDVRGTAEFKAQIAGVLIAKCALEAIGAKL